MQMIRKQLAMMKRDVLSEKYEKKTTGHDVA
jgi:hypothetical protein